MPRPNLGFSQRDPHTFGKRVHDGSAAIWRGSFNDAGTDDVTLTVADVMESGVIQWNPGAGSKTLTLPSADALIDTHNLGVDDVFEFTILNVDGSNAGDLGAGAGWTEMDADNNWATATDDALLAKSETRVIARVTSATAITAWVQSNVTST
jgi:hypothetical protein|tara:strand:- start:2415 stop:2870 length:456 start_codon:yes stop_codon:yes gene_type:complete